MLQTSPKERFYDGIAESFDAIMNPYDLHRRVEVVCHELIGRQTFAGRRILDVGCGTGWFSREAVQAGADVVAIDIGINLLRKVAETCGAKRVAADACLLCLPDDTFNIVLSSECVEHTADPKRALAEMCRVLKPEGILVVTVPNQFWRWAEVVARVLKLRPYEGLENWLWWSELSGELRRHGMRIDRMRGIHLFPPAFRLTWPLLHRADAAGHVLGPMMVNLAVRASKQPIV